MLEPSYAHELLTTARQIQEEISSVGLHRHDSARQPSPERWLERYDEAVTAEPLRHATRKLYGNAHYARAVEEAFKCLNNGVKEKSGLGALDGDALMRRAFSPDKPILKVNVLKTKSQKDEQRGYMELYAGVMTGVRNPRAHEHRLEDDPVSALELLTLANHLMGKLDACKKARRRKA